MNHIGLVEASRTHLSGLLLEAIFLSRRTQCRSTHHGTSVLDSLRYGFKPLGSGQVSLLSGVLTDTAEGAQETFSHL